MLLKTLLRVGETSDGHSLRNKVILYPELKSKQEFSITEAKIQAKMTERHGKISSIYKQQII